VAESTEFWAAALKDNDFGIRKHAIERMPAKPFEQLRDELLREALESPFAPIRKAACDAFARYDRAYLLSACEQKLRANPTPRVLDALGWVGGEKAGSLIGEVITGSAQPLVVEYAFRVLTRQPDEVGFKLLSGIAGDAKRSPSQRVEAIGSLGRFHLRRNLEFLIALLDDPDLEMNAAVWDALRELTGKTFVPERREWEKWLSTVGDNLVWHDKDTLPSVEAEELVEAKRQEAVDAACKWLIRHQSEDGRFDALNYSKHEGYQAGRGTNDTDVCMTSLAILSFISAGISGDSEASRARASACARAVKWLISSARRPGDHRGTNPVTYVHEQGAATWALAEYFAASHKEIGSDLTAALNICMEYRDGDKVWGYPGMPGNTSNSCVTFWYAAAFAAAREGGMDAPVKGWEAIADWFDSATIEYSGYVFNAGIKEPSEAMTGVGLLAKGFMMYDISDRLQRRSASLLLKRPIGRISYYDLYCYSLGLAWMEAPEAQAYRRKIALWLIENQETDANSAINGSWDPRGDIWETSRLYTAGMAIPCLDLAMANGDSADRPGLAALRAAKAMFAE
jgi:hypothetical protein